MTKYKKVKNNHDIPLTKPLINEDNDEDFVSLEDYKEVLQNTNFYWINNKKFLHVDCHRDIPKKYITKNLFTKKEYIDCTYFIGYLTESIKELLERVDYLEKKVKELSK